MFFTTLLFLFSMSGLAMSAPTRHSKRIIVNAEDSLKLFQSVCVNGGGGGRCRSAAISAFSTLLGAAGPCDQQDQSDNLIDLAKSLSNSADLIPLAQIFAQQPRDTFNSLSVPYCQKAPRNAELNGLFQCQFAGSNPNLFSADLTTAKGAIPVGEAGTIPFGHSSPLSPPGSCPANPSGPIPDGSQLVDITQNPGVGSTGAASTQTENNSSNGVAVGSQNPGVGSSTGFASTQSENNSFNGVAVGATDGTTQVLAVTSTIAASIATPTAISEDGGSDSIYLQNSKDAQALNAKFAQLTADSACNDGEDACVGASFAQCVGGKFILTACGTGTVCAALPLVNIRGTSITCANAADALSTLG